MVASSPVTRPPLHGSPRRRDQRGVAFPSPLVMLSIIAVAMAGLAFVATRHQPVTEKRIDTAAATATPTPTPTKKPTSTATKKPKPALDRSSVYVEVYNNSGIKGLAGRTAATATDLGWQVVGEDNWYGTIPASTAYYPPGQRRLQRAAKQLALDLGLRRTAPAVDPMRMDRLTVVLTGDVS